MVDFYRINNVIIEVIIEGKGFNNFLVGNVICLNVWNKFLN